jgi:hypothetical protein
LLDLGKTYYFSMEFRERTVGVHHAEPTAASGGKNSEIELGSLFNRSGLGPEHQELVRLITSLIDDPRGTSSA